MKFKPEEINLEITEIYPFRREERWGIVISWSADIGFGEYTLYQESGSDKWYADSECMDKGENKQMLRYLLKLIADMVEIEG